MNIRNRLTFRFILIVAVIILISSLIVYISSASYRESEFYSRLQNNAINTAKLLIEVDEVDVDLLRRIETDNPVSLPNEKIVIYDFRNEVIFSTDDERELKINNDLLNQIRLEDEVHLRQDSYEVLDFLFKGPYDRFVVVSGATDIYGLNKVRNLRNILLIVFVISIVVVSVSGWFYAGKSLEPISHVVQQVDEIGISSLNLRVDEGNGKDEIAHLAQTFNRMLARLESSFKVQKNFIANASHEFRTPLTAITGQLEVALLNARSNDEYQSAIDSVLEDIRALNNLSNRLLVLAQTSSEAIENRHTQLRVDELIWQAREDLIRVSPSYIIRIDITDEVDDESLLIMEGDEQLIKVTVSNLMENGCKYSADQSVEVVIGATTSGIDLIFRDRGIGIPEHELPNVFEPFYRASNTTSIKGNGIGLSMVRQIVVMHHGSIRIDSKPGTGTSVTVWFPSIVS
jgi:signal transduction histidine kinase